MSVFSVRHNPEPANGDNFSVKEEQCSAGDAAEKNACQRQQLPATYDLPLNKEGHYHAERSVEQAHHTVAAMDLNENFL